MTLMSCELLNNADFYFCYEIKNACNVEFEMQKQKCNSFTQVHQSLITPYMI